MIRVDALWLSTRPLDMRAGTETILSQVVRTGEELGELLVHHRVMRDGCLELGFLRGVLQFAVFQQVGHFEEVAVFGELLDGVLDT